MNEHDLHYLKSILGMLQTVRTKFHHDSGATLAGEVLSDNINWLDCFIDKYERARQKQKQNFAAAMQRRRAGHVYKNRFNTP